MTQDISWYRWKRWKEHEIDVGSTLDQPECAAQAQPADPPPQTCPPEVKP